MKLAWPQDREAIKALLDRVGKNEITLVGAAKEAEVSKATIHRWRGHFEDTTSGTSERHERAARAAGTTTSPGPEDNGHASGEEGSTFWTKEGVATLSAFMIGIGVRMGARGAPPEVIDECAELSKQEHATLVAHADLALPYLREQGDLPPVVGLVVYAGVVAGVALPKIATARRHIVAEESSEEVVVTDAQTHGPDTVPSQPSPGGDEPSTSGKPSPDVTVP